jgi:hypothetical protein
MDLSGSEQEHGNGPSGSIDSRTISQLSEKHRPARPIIMIVKMMWTMMGFIRRQMPRYFKVNHRRFLSIPYSSLHLTSAPDTVSTP